jgi:hypothetical protein
LAKEKSFEIEKETLITVKEGKNYYKRTGKKGKRT